MLFNIHQCMYAVFLGKSLRGFVFMLPHASGQVAGYTRVQGSVALAGHYVHDRLFGHGAFMDSRFRGNDVS